MYMPGFRIENIFNTTSISMSINIALSHAQNVGKRHCRVRGVETLKYVRIETHVRDHKIALTVENCFSNTH